jgi:Asp-tRNA(Asn)/Glu-tRNA(Gln) amidotransferase B subunit
MKTDIKAVYRAEDQTVMVESSGYAMSIDAKDIQQLITELLQAHSDYVDDQLRRQRNAKNQDH